MRHDLTAVFNNRDDARQVLDELILSGFPRSGTSLVSPPEAGDTERPPDAESRNTLRQLLARLFGPWHDAPERVDESGFLPGRHVITLTGAIEPDSIRAIGIMERANPVYIEDRHRQAVRAPVGAAPGPPPKRTFRVHKKRTDCARPSR
ncbi:MULTISPECIES: hypothetical protein [Massilia]|uniref:Uncharacterized protein n=2 Tax=Massilia TaxID=149698 RepID=A0A7X3FZ11_9BURK|nr:hypothetical protein [Telluria cellulosilytica]MDN4046169.1 hypothetical protein [Massilia sp. YIM B02787]MVW60623.1 hypothetical protein [Telluria cellulosilytica]